MRGILHSTKSITTTAACVVFIGLAGVSLTRAQTVRTVQLLDHEFSPPHLSLLVGDTVHWVWVSNFHNVESGTINGFDMTPDGRFRSGDPDFDLTYDLTFDRAFLDAHPASDDAYPYYCFIHAFEGMVGVIAVVDCLVDADCPDTNSCTDDRCVAGACQHSLNVSACDDRDVCTAGDVCANGVCGGTPIANCCRSHSDCGDGNVCTADFCEGGVCRSSPGPAAPCDDHDPCTGSDACLQGLCKGTPLAVCCRTNTDCDDEVDCTDDRCEVGICLHTANQRSCDDGDACTDDDRCENAACAGTPIDDCCVTDDDCPSVTCRQVICQDHGCVGTPIDGCLLCGTAADCDDENPCTSDDCTAGACGNIPNESICDDGDACTQDDRCSAGLCTGAPIDACCTSDADCDDHDACTEDGCVEAVCDHPAILNCETTSGGDHADPDEPAGQDVPSPRLCGAIGVLPLTALVGLIGPKSRRKGIPRYR